MRLKLTSWWFHLSDWFWCYRKNSSIEKKCKEKKTSIVSCQRKKLCSLYQKLIVLLQVSNLATKYNEEVVLGQNIVLLHAKMVRMILISIRHTERFSHSFINTSYLVQDLNSAFPDSVSISLYLFVWDTLDIFWKEKIY